MVLMNILHKCNTGGRKTALRQNLIFLQQDGSEHTDVRHFTHEKYRRLRTCAPIYPPKFFHPLMAATHTHTCAVSFVPPA